MKLWIIVAVLVVVLVGGGVFFGLQIVHLSEQIGELRLNYATLQTSHNNLQSNYNTLEANYQTTLNNYNLLDANNKRLQSNFNSLNVDFQSLTTDYAELESDYNSLQSDYDEIKGEVTILQINNNNLQNENRDLQRLLTEYENVPHSYYSAGNFAQHSNTFNELSKFLTSEFALPTGYKINVFDCSESTAYLEWALENAGFDADIVTGPTPWDTNGDYHAWVIAHTTDYRVAIDATAITGEYNWSYLFANRVPGVVYRDDNLIPGWENYYNGYDKSFQNIYHAIRNWTNTKEWNWWEGFWGFE